MSDLQESSAELRASKLCEELEVEQAKNTKLLAENAELTKKVDGMLKCSYRPTSPAYSPTSPPCRGAPTKWVNACLECGVDMGRGNPRQFCGKTRCGSPPVPTRLAPQRSKFRVESPWKRARSTLERARSTLERTVRP